MAHLHLLDLPVEILEKITARVSSKDVPAIRLSHPILRKTRKEASRDHYQAFMCRLAKRGNIQELTRSQKLGTPWDIAKCASAAAYGGHLEILHWMANTLGYCFLAENVTSAVLGGHTQILRWMMRRKHVPVDVGPTVAAALTGNTSLLELFFEHDWSMVGRPGPQWDQPLVVHRKYRRFLQWVQQVEGFTSYTKETSIVYTAAAFTGNISILEFLEARHGPLWNACTSCAAAAHGHLPVLQWLQAKRCPSNPETSMRYAALHGHQHILVWYVMQGQPLSATTMVGAAEGAHWDILFWLYRHRCPWDAAACESAVRGGHLDVLRWLRQHDCPWDWRTCEAAVGVQNKRILAWLLEQPSLPNHEVHDMVEWMAELLEQDAVEHLVSYAAENGYLESLQFLYASGISVRHAALVAGMHQQWEILAWMHQEKIPFLGTEAEMASLDLSFEFLQWMQRHGYPWNRSSDGTDITDDIREAAVRVGDYVFVDWVDTLT